MQFDPELRVWFFLDVFAAMSPFFSF